MPITSCASPGYTQLQSCVATNWKFPRLPRWIQQFVRVVHTTQENSLLNIANLLQNIFYLKIMLSSLADIFFIPFRERGKESEKH